MFCRNCGKEIAGKICSACGVKRGHGEGYCSWCGNEIAKGAQICPMCNELTKTPSAVVNIMKIILSVFFFLMALGSFSDNIMGALLLILCGVFSLPVFRDWIQKKTHDNRGLRKPLQWARIIATIVCFIIAFSLSPSGAGSGSSSDSIGKPLVNSSGVAYTDKEIELIAEEAVGDKLLSFASNSLITGYYKTTVEQIRYKSAYGEITGTVELFNEAHKTVDKNGNYKEGKKYRFTVKIDRDTLEVTCTIR